QNVIKEGLDIFEDTFGYRSKSFIACKYVIPAELETKLSENGVSFIQGQRGHISPITDTGEIRIRRNFIGQTNENNQIFLIRNCFLEPSSEPGKDWVTSCLRQIETAFWWKK